MHRTLHATMVVAMTALLAVPPVATAQAVRQDSAMGSGIAVDEFGTTWTFDFDAVSGSSGEVPSGSSTATVSFLTGIFVGPVTCLSVTGNRAVVGVDLTGDLGRAGMYAFVVDGGPAGSGLDTYVAVGGPANPQDCGTVTEPLDRATVVSGDLVVHDASPLPTSQVQCKTDGWRGFGDTFKNQGQCVAFVQRGPKP